LVWVKPPFARNPFLQKRWWKSRCYKCEISSILLAANSAVEQVAYETLATETENSFKT